MNQKLPTGCREKRSFWRIRLGLGVEYSFDFQNRESWCLPRPRDHFPLAWLQRNTLSMSLDLRVLVDSNRACDVLSIGAVRFGRSTFSPSEASLRILRPGATGATNAGGGGRAV